MQRPQTNNVHLYHFNYNFNNMTFFKCYINNKYIIIKNKNKHKKLYNMEVKELCRDQKVKKTYKHYHYLYLFIKLTKL